MKLPVRILLGVLCACLVLAMPFVLSSPSMLGEVKWQLLDEMEGEDEGFLRYLLPRAYAEEAVEYELPIDFSAGMEPNPALFTESGYEDASIRVQMETREEDGVIWRIAWVEIASPTQLRTAIAGKKVTSNSSALVKSMAEKNNAVVALNGDYYSNDPNKTTFEYRMGEKVRAKTNQKKDILIIDDQGDFHIVMAQAKKDQQAALDAVAAEYTIVNAFTFGPALVRDGESLKMNKDYGYNPNGREPRAAIGQLDHLSYVMVIAEGRGESKGVTHQELADFMFLLGCQNAFNLDGGGSATLIYHGDYYNTLGGSPRSMSDMIYFATAVPPEDWKE